MVENDAQKPGEHEPNPEFLRLMGKTTPRELQDLIVEEEVVDAASGGTNTKTRIDKMREATKLNIIDHGEGKVRIQPTEPKPVWLGKGRVRVGDKVLALEFQEGTVLQTLVELGAATGKNLERTSGVDDAVRVLKKLRTKYPELEPHIILPRARGRGGYSTTIRAE